MRLRAFLTPSLCALLALTACDKKDATETQTTETETSETTGTKTPEVPKEADATPDKPKEEKAEAKLEVDEEFMAALEAVVANCTEFTKSGWASKCKAEEPKKLDDLLRKKNEAVFETLVAALAKEDIKLKQLAAKKLYTTGQYHVPRLAKSGKLRPEAAAQLAALVLGHDEVATNIARESIRAAVLATAATDQHELANKLVTKYKSSGNQAEGWAHANALEVSMRYGRMRMFDIVKASAASERSDIRRAAFGAPRRMQEWTAEEDKTLCAWAKTHIGTVGQADDGPGRVLLKCKDSKGSRTALLEEFKKRGKAGTLKQPFTFLLYELCQPNSFKEDRRLPEICKRTRKLATTMLRDKKLGTYERLDAMRTLSQRWPDATSIKLITKFSKNKEERIAKEADKQITYIKERMAKKKK